MTILGCIPHSLQAFMTKSNEWSDNNKEVVHTRAPICNVLAVAYKYRDSLAFKALNNYKRKGKQNQKVHTKFHPKTTLKSNPLSKLLSDLIIGGVFGKHYTSLFFSQFESYCRFYISDVFNSLRPSTKTRNSTAEFLHHHIYIYIYRKTRISLNKTKRNYII